MHQEQLAAWIEAQLDARVLDIVHNTAGSSRQTFMVTAQRSGGERVEAVVRHDIGTGPFSGSAFTLQREASLLSALAKCGLPAPRCLALSDDNTTELLERLPGRAEPDFASPADRTAIGLQYVDLVSRLHAIEPESLELPLCPRPVSPTDHALLDLAQWDDFMARRRLGEASPTVAIASAWLRKNAPKNPDGTVLVHGDCGPGNFLHDGRRVTGMLDWELTHWGDPMDDLAWWWFRETTQAVRTDLAPWYQHYAKLTGRAIDEQRIRYYRVFVLYRCSIATLSDRVLVGHSPLMVARLAQALLAEDVNDARLTDAAANNPAPLEPLAFS